MAARKHVRATAPKSAAREHGGTQAGSLQAFLLQLEREGLVQRVTPRGQASAGSTESPASRLGSADKENAVRKLIAVLREPS